MSARRVPRAEYAALDAVNWSTLTEMRRSPLHYRHRCETPQRDTLAMAKGRAAHTSVFEPDRFPLEYAVYSEGRRGTNEFKAFVEANPGRTILKPEEYAACLGMRDAVRRHPVASQYLRLGEAEIPIAWTDNATGLACKARLDWVGSHLIPAQAIVDLKTTRSITAWRFGETAARLGYHCQLAHYRAGWAAVTGEELPCAIIAVESAAPFDVAVYVLDDDALYAGGEEVGEALARVAKCKASGVWSGQYPEAQVLRLPAWIYGDDEDGDDGMPAAVADLS